MQHYGIQTTERKRQKTPLWIVLLALPVCALLGLTMATQKTAVEYGFQDVLGQPLCMLFDTPLYAPWQILLWDGIAPHVLDNAITVGGVFFIAPFLGLCLVLYASRPKGNEQLHGSARWAGKKEIKAMGYCNGEGVYVGGYWDKQDKKLLYLRHNGPEHILCFAPTRSGKGVGLILPSLLSWQGSSLTLDIKGENWALTSGWRQSQGHKVLRFDPTDASGNGCAFNPLEEVRLTQLEAIQDVQALALMLVDPSGKGLEDHWTKAAFAFFAGAILHCCIMTQARHRRTATLQDVTLMLSSEAGTLDELLDEMLAESHAELLCGIAPDCDPRVGEACHTFIASSAREMSAKAENERSGVLSTALVNLALYRDPIIHINTSRSDFRIHDLMNSEQPVDLYLVVPPNGIDRVRPLMRLIVDMIVRRICASMEFANGTSVAGYKHRMLFMLDEFTSLGKLPIIEKAIAYIAGYGGKLYIIVQDIKQLNEVYGKENAIMSNCHVRIAYAPNDPETAELLSKMTGTTTVVEQKISVSGGSSKQRSVSASIQETARPLLTPDECSRLPGAVKDAQGRVTAPGHMLLFTAGQSPVYGMQILYFKDPTFIQRAKIQPPKITDSLYFPRSASVQPLPSAKETLRLANFLDGEK